MSNRTIKVRWKAPETGEWEYANIEDITAQIDFGGTLGQYAGLKDKDKKEIYEGDIVEYRGLHLIVSFANGHFMIHGGKCREDLFKGNHEDLWKALGRISVEDKRENTVKVIGNIYDNSELLKK